MDIKRTIKKHYKLIYAHKFDNLEIVYQSFERQNLPKLTWEEIDNINSPKCLLK